MSTMPSAQYRSPPALILLGLFLLVVIGVGAWIGLATAPGPWYEALQKPPFNPPNWLFGPVWFALYVMIAIAGWRTALDAPRSPAMLVWGAQMVVNWAWSGVWFTLHLLWPAFAVIVVLLALILAFIALRWRRDRVSAWLFVPYAAWICFAGLLNLCVAILN